MTELPVRRTCAHCGRSLPRAALNRCPHCRRPAKPEAAAGNACRRCARPLPRAHAGQCPACAVAARHAGAATDQERRR